MISEDIMIKTKDQIFPYSKGILTQSLISAGVSNSKAYLIAKAIEKKLHLLETHVVESGVIKNIALKALEVECGKEYAERYNLWRSFVKSNQSLIILIGGATGTGKSTLGLALAHRLGVSHIIGTDTLREVMRKILPRDLFPTIHCSSYLAGECINGLRLPEKDTTILGFQEHVKNVSVGIDAVIERSIIENIKIIIEGIHILPKYLKSFSHENVVCFFVAIENEVDHKMRFEARETATKSRYASRYIASFDAIRKIQEYILLEAKKVDVPIIEERTIEKGVEQMYLKVIDKIKKLLN